MIIISLLLLGSLLPHLSFSTSVNVGIVNGSEARPHSRPYMVSVQKKGKHVCSGFLISDQFVMTAARCKTEGDLTVVAGTDKLTNRKGHVRIHVKSYYKHKPDLMVLELNESVQLDKNINKIPIPTGQVKIKVGTKCSVAGWGESTHYGPISLNLQVANVMVMSDEVCQHQWGPKYDTLQMMCVYGERKSCPGDIGGPLVCGNTAVSVSSFGSENNCNDPEKHNVYLNISAFLPWIRKITSNSK